MSDKVDNPYQTPDAVEEDPSFGSSGSPRAINLIIPPILMVGCTLAFWLGFASALVNMLNAANAMFIWSGTLFLSVTASIFLITRLWRRPLSALSISAAYVIFGVVFCLLEGDTSNGTDRVQMIILYGSLTALPFLAFALTQILKRSKSRAF
ncbi:MAG: hypothetical protein AAGG48_09765 [Planctomycetota bacterium]